MVVNATLSNFITNFLHAFLLFIYFIFAARHYLQDKKRYFSFSIVLFFFLTFLLKIIGAFVHLQVMSPYAEKMWLAIAIGVLLLNYLVVINLSTANIYKIITMVFSLLCVVLFFLSAENFLYLALNILVSNIIFACVTQSWVRRGFVLIVIANVVWLSLRQGFNYILGHEVPLEMRYDNDIYHLILIIGTFVLYKGIAKGLWQYPK